MDTFESTTKKNNFFYYRRGNVHTNKIWTRPSYFKIRKFLEKITEETDILSDYEVYLMGGVLFSFVDTWDVDICIVGEIKDYLKLEKYMDTMYDISLNEFQMLIDVQWLEAPLPEVSYQELISPLFKNYNLKFVKTTYIIKQIGENKSFFDLRNREDINVMTEFLVQGIHDEYPKTKQKLVDRILKSPNKKLKSYMNIIDFLNNDENYFLNNTNRL